MADFQNVDVDETPQYQPIQLKKAEGKEPIEAVLAHDELVSRHMGRFKEWQNWRRPFETIWEEIYALYLTVSRTGKLPTRSKISIPIVFQVIEAAVPKLVSIIFGQSPFFQVVSRFPHRDPVSEETLADIHTLLDYQLSLAGFFTKFVDFTKQLFMYGTSYLYVYWTVKREWVWERQPVRDQFTIFGIRVPFMDLKWEKKLEYKVIERRPEVEVLAIEDVYPDPNSRDEKSSEGIYVTSYISLEELKELSTGKFPIYANYDRVAETSNNEKESGVWRDKRSIRGLNGTPQIKDKGQVELITFWGKEDIDGDGIREEVQLVFANRQVLIKAIRNPFEHQKRPVIRNVLFSVPMEWFGMGLIEPIIPLVHELDTIRRQHVDVNNQIINRMYIVAATSDTDIDTVVTGPNNVILAGNVHDDIKPLEQQPLPFSPTQHADMIQGDIESATTPKSIQGSPEGGTLGRTARGAQLIISQALEKFGMSARLIEENAVKKVLDMFYALNLQYLDSDQVLADPVLYGNVWKDKKTPEQIRGAVQFKLLGISETITKEAMFNQLVAFVNTFGQLPGIDLLRVAKTAWNLMQLNVPADDVIKPAPFPTSQVVQQFTPGDPGVQAQIQSNGAASELNVPKQ